MDKAILFCGILLPILLLHNGVPVAAQEVELAGLKFLEINNTLYCIAPEPESKWKEAHVQCKQKKMSLIKPASNGIELQNYIKQNFELFPSFWSENNATQTTLMQKLGFKKKSKGLKCNKIDRKTFEIKAEDCDTELGFICESPLHFDAAEFRHKHRKYYIEPANKFYCGNVRSECAKRNMTLVLLNTFNSNILIRDFIFFRYGVRPSFWLAKSNNSQECFPWTKTARIAKGAEHGFICESTEVNPSFTFRHLVLISGIAVALVISIIVFIALKCYFRQKVAEINHEIQHEKKPCDCLLKATVACNFL